MAKGYEVVLAEKLEENKLALPEGFNKERFVQNVLALTDSNKDLQEWARKHEDAGRQIVKGAMRGAFLGLDFINRECYLIPYGNELQFMTDYKGQKKLCKKYSKRPIKEIYAKVVRDGDEFQESITDGEPHIDFKPLAFNNGKVIGAFAVCLFSDGGMIYETMSVNELENVRKKSKMGKGGAWASFTEEMYKKVVLRRLCKGIELDFDNYHQLESFNSDTDIRTDAEVIEQNVQEEIAEKANTQELLIEEEQPEVVADAEVVNAENPVPFV